MIDYTEEKRKRSIENSFTEYPWLAKFLQKERLHELLVKEDIKPDFFLKGSDSFMHMEVMWLLDKDGVFLGEVDDFETTTNTNIFSFEVHYETIGQALERVHGETFYILKNKNFMHVVLYRAPGKKSLREYFHECIRTR